MPDSFADRQREWQRKEAPLLELDDGIERFALAHSMTVEKNYHGNEPNRMLRWSSHGLNKTIQLSLEDIEKMTFFIGLYAWKDVDGKRDTQEAPPKWHLPWHQFKSELGSLLEESYQTLEAMRDAGLNLSGEQSPAFDMAQGVVIKSFADVSEADRANAILQAASIPALVRGNKPHLPSLLTSLWPARWRLIVAPADRERAEQLLRSIEHA